MGKAENGEIREVTANIWEDRKHHLWFPLSFTKYTVGNGRLYVNSGFLSSREDECLLYRITDITLYRSLPQRIFGTGTIELHTKDRSTPVIRLENIAKSAEVKRVLSDLIEREREEKHVVGRDMYGAISRPDGRDTRRSYVEILEFTHFAEYYNFNTVNENHRKKEIVNKITVIVALDLGTRDTKNLKYENE